MVIAGSWIYLSHKWYQRAWSYDFNLHRSYFDAHIGNNYQRLLLAVVMVLLLWLFAGGVIVRAFLPEPKVFPAATRPRGNPDKGQQNTGLVGPMVLNWGSHVMAGRMPLRSF